MRATGDGVAYDRSHLREYIPDWLVLYCVLGVCDLGFTLVAFQFGVREANPVLARFQSLGLFEFAKLSMTLLVLCICFRLRKSALIQNIMYLANAVMATIVVYHVASLCAFFG